MTCANIVNGFCEILQIECKHPEENNPDNYNEETGFPCICGMFTPEE